MASVDNVEDIAPDRQYVAAAAQADFDYPFPIFTDADIVVDVDGVVKTLSTHYAVTGEGEDTGGTVTFVTPLVGGEIVTLYRDVAIERTSDIQQNGPLSSAALNDELDRFTMWAQQLESRLGRSIRLAISNPQASSELELDATFEGKYLFINSDGELEPAAAVSTTTLTQSILGALLNPRTGAEIAVGVTPTDYSVPSHEKVTLVFAARYGWSTAASAANNKVALDNAMLVVAQIGSGVVALGAGTYDIPNITCAQNGCVFVGTGESSTLLRYATPTGDGVAVKFSKGAASIVRSGISDVGFISASTSTKTAVMFQDGRQSIFQRVAVNSGNWPGPDSIGLRTYGRDFYSIIECDIECARPWLISLNPNQGDLHADMSIVRSCQFASTVSTGKNIEVESGVELTNFKFDTVDMAGGKYGFYWVDTASNVAPYHLSFINCRYEQNADAAGFSFYIETNAALQNVYWEQCHFDPACGGIHLRNAQKISLKDCTFPGAAGITNLDITFISTTFLVLENTLVQALSTVTLTSAVLCGGDELQSSGPVVPPNAEYKFDQGAIISQHTIIGPNGERIWAYVGTLANNGTINTPFLRTLYTSAEVSVTGYGATGPVKAGGFAVWFKDGTCTKCGGTTNFVDTAVGAEIRCLDGGSGLVVINTLGQPITVRIRVSAAL